MAPDFGTILRRLRVAKGMSQEALAEAARTSADAVSTYERGVRKRPHRETAAMLANALGLDAKNRFDFIALARATTGHDGGPAQGNLPLDRTSFALLLVHSLATIAALEEDPLRAALLFGFVNKNSSFRQPTEQYG